ncbi:MAG: YebC/PmpR family DNA-binding transcriptional regulator [Ruminococcaceae bacterium]|nr:YebC/PmpR family DNA-binding transcriptional regulator [Oscillospiraceae bacterium]
MSGHSKWNNIKHKKEKTDAQRAKVFTKVGKEMAVAVKEGGPDPVSNSKLATLIAKAKTLNVPNDNIERIIKKASSADAADYEEITYEGYGPAGIAFIVQATTDSRNRTAGNVRHYFDKFGGNLGTVGCVSFMFEDKGVIVIEKEDVDEDQLMEDALEAGATDFLAEDEVFEIYTEVDDVAAVAKTLTDKGYTYVSAEEDKIPQSYVNVTDEDAVTNMNKLIDALEDDDDITAFFHNWEEA